MIRFSESNINVFPEQSSLVTLLQKYLSNNGVLTDPYFRGNPCELGLYYGTDKIVYDTHLILFNEVKDNIPQCKKWYFVHHPIRTNLIKWNLNKWNGKTIKWSTVLSKKLTFEKYQEYIIEKDTDNSISDLRLALHSLERHIPVLSDEDFCKPYYHKAHCTDIKKISIDLAYNNLRTPMCHLSQDRFISSLVNIVGRIHENKS